MTVDVHFGTLFAHPWSVYASIPLGAALIGWPPRFSR